LPLRHIIWKSPFFMRLPSFDEIVAVQKRIAPFARRTPVITMQSAAGELSLKLELFQAAGAFKSRPAAALLTAMSSDARARGVMTASSGNFGIAVAMLGPRLQAPVAIVVPEDAPHAKVDRLKALGAHILVVDAEVWWETVITHQFAGSTSFYLDAVADPVAIAANGAIAIELLEERPELDAIAIPFGGGGLLCGIAAAMKALKPGVRIIACEGDFSSPLCAARAAGEPVKIAPQRSFVSGIGAPAVLPSMWPLLRDCVDEVVVVSSSEIADAIRRLAIEAHIVAEGAGAVSVAAALSGKIKATHIACIVSGGNIGRQTLAEIFAGGVPDQ
jgi:threonine dehydratase